MTHNVTTMQEIGLPLLPGVLPSLILRQVMPDMIVSSFHLDYYRESLLDSLKAVDNPDLEIPAPSRGSANLYQSVAGAQRLLGQVDDSVRNYKNMIHHAWPFDSVWYAPIGNREYERNLATQTEMKGLAALGAFAIGDVERGRRFLEFARITAQADQTDSFERQIWAVAPAVLLGEEVPEDTLEQLQETRKRGLKKARGGWGRYHYHSHFPATLGALVQYRLTGDAKSQLALKKALEGIILDCDIKEHTLAVVFILGIQNACPDFVPKIL